MPRKLVADALRLQLDLLRSQGDFVTGMSSRRWLRSRAPMALVDRPVITLPGFGAPESSHRYLRRFLAHCGYPVTTCQPGFPRQQTIPEFVARLDQTLGREIKQLADRHGCAVTLIGQSAGGLFAREYAALRPEGIDRVITLAAPTNDPRQMKLQNRAMEKIICRMSGASGFNETAGPQGLYHWPADTPAIPYVAICSPVDGAVPEPTALIPAEIVRNSTRLAPRENIRIRSSHFGMQYHSLVMLAVADRLRQSRDNWQPFDARRYLPRLPEPLFRMLLPDSAGGDRPQGDGLALAV
ncbi:MAG: esterase/lipase family protein [Parahaliea sp.]